MHKAGVHTPVQKGRLCHIFNRQHIGACKHGREGGRRWRRERRRGGGRRGGRRREGEEGKVREGGRRGGREGRYKCGLVFAQVQSELTCWTVCLCIDSFWRLVLGRFLLGVLHSTSRLRPLLSAPWARGGTSKGGRRQVQVPEHSSAILCCHTACGQHNELTRALVPIKRASPWIQCNSTHTWFH